jgi:Phosphoribosylanthranilate isomerase
MPSSKKIKICGLTGESDVDLALSLGADYCGFIVYPNSPRGIELERAAELAQRVPDGQRVMVDVSPKASKILQGRELGFNVFQIHIGLDISTELVREYAEAAGSGNLWLAPRIGPGDAFPEQFLEFTDTFLIDTYSKDQVGGTGKTGDWGRFSQYQKTYPDVCFILAGGLSADNILEAVEATGTDHLDLNSGLELSPGIKSPEKVRRLFAQLAKL